MADWITVKNRDNCTRIYSFRKTFCSESAESFKVRISADSRYRLYINGNFISEGPCRGNEKYYEKIDASAFLKNGENFIEVLVLDIREFSWSSVVKGGECALWFDGVIEKDGDKIPVVSDTTWEYALLNHISFRQAKVGLPFVNQYETYNLTEKNVVYETCALLYMPNPGFCTRTGTLDKYFLQERPIPQMHHGNEEKPEIVRSSENYLELDALRYVTADFRLRFKAKKGAVVRITYSECRYPKDAEKIMVKGIRDDEKGKLIGDFDEVISDGEIFEFIPYCYRTFRYVGIEFEKESEFELVSCSFNHYHYPMEDEAKFCCSDETLNEMWRVSLNTVKNCSHEIIEDCPYHEQQQYIMDSSLIMLYHFRIHSDLRLARKAILEFCNSVNSYGFAAANYPSANIQIIPGFSLLLIKMIYDYYIHSGDISLLKKTVGACETILNTFEELRREDLLVSDAPYWNFIDWVDGWSNGTPTPFGNSPLTVYNMMYAASLSCMAQIYKAIGREGSRRDCIDKYEVQKTAINEHCYDIEVGLYENRPKSKTYSYHAQLWAVLAGLVSKEEGRNLLLRMLEREKIDKCSFSMNFFLLRALEKTGLYEKSHIILDNWKKMLDLHCTTWGESLSFPRSECHGWSSAPLYELSAMYLGVNPIEAGFKTVRINPYTKTLDFAKGEVPTPYGKIYVSWKKEKGKVILAVKAPKEITKEIVSADEIRVTDDAEIETIIDKA